MTDDLQAAWAAAPAASEGADQLRVGRKGGVGLVEIDRPAQRNALNIAMRHSLAEALPRFARDPDIYTLVVRSMVPGVFSAGGDVREMAELWQRDEAAGRRAFAAELELVWRHECFSKPTVALIDGLVMGAGVGISLYGTHRVAGPDYAFAMPECALGFIPDCGVAWTFARMPDQIGLYLALTGRRIGRADALALGLVTHCIEAPAAAGIVTALCDYEPVDAVLDRHAIDPGPPPLAEHRSLIAECFSAPTIEEIADRLERAADTAAGRVWATGVLADLARASPLALKITLRHVREAVALDLRQTLIRDFRVGGRLLAGGQLREGVRALLIDKDHSPRWRPAVVADVGEAMVERHFAWRAGDDLVLATRQELQDGRR